MSARDILCSLKLELVTPDGTVRVRKFRGSKVTAKALMQAIITASLEE